MERKLGKTGVSVFPVGWGPMPLSTRGTRPERQEALAVFKAALDAGVNFWDTANAYCLDDGETGHNERLIAWARKELGVGREVTLASKGGMTRPGGAWVKNGRPAHLIKACEQSLRDLGVDEIFLYQLHWPDPDVPYAESIGALADLQSEGKIVHVGISNVTPGQLREAQGIVRVESVQNRCAPTDQEDFRNGLIELCEEGGTAFIPYSPMGGGPGYKAMPKKGVLGNLAGKYGVSAYQVIVAWLLGKSDVIIPIPGASRVASLSDNAAAATLQLTPEDAAAIEAM